MNEQKIIQNIKKIRELKNFKQDYIAHQLEISVRAYSKIENGETALTFNRFFRIASVLEIKPEELISFNYKDFFNSNTKSNHQSNYDNDMELTKILLKSKDEQIALLKEQIELIKNL